MAMEKLLSGENKLTPLLQDTEKLKEQDRMLLKVNRRKVKQVGNISNGKSFNGNPQVGRVYDSDGIAPSLNTMQGGGREPKIIVNPHGFNKGGIKNISPTVTAGAFKDNNFILENMRIRKLTPLECWRLQGFPDSAFTRAEEVNSNSQLYKQAGNSVTVPVIYEMAKRMEIENDETDS
ncbi:hypothetical protein EFN43_08435 [Pediococcus pentosaceus]|nr:DNA cytosine methyltransferase [Pediococcus pentosaceus]MCT3021083.1 hypothetical protein [Pediococcus pentosaceus]